MQERSSTEFATRSYHLFFIRMFHVVNVCQCKRKKFCYLMEVNEKPTNVFSLHFRCLWMLLVYFARSEIDDLFFNIFLSQTLTTFLICIVSNSYFIPDHHFMYSLYLRPVSMAYNFLIESFQRTRTWKEERGMGQNKKDRYTENMEQNKVGRKRYWEMSRDIEINRDEERYREK